MTRRVWLILAVVAVVALGAGVGIGAATWAGCDHADASATSGHGTVAAALDDAHGSAMTEQAFLEQMVPHHESAIQMAQIAVAKGVSAEVRGLADDILATQHDEIAQMRAIHRDAFGQELDPSDMGPHSSVDLSGLEAASGPEFDRVFLRMMLPHHASAIAMCEEVMMGAPREEIGALADEIVAAQAKEIGEMQEWRERFFPPLG
jgi:uncharacterized protein (DUF305 family)